LHEKIEKRKLANLRRSSCKSRPLDRVAQSLLEVHLHLITKMFPRETDIGQRMFEVAGSLGRIRHLSPVTGQLAQYL